MMDYSLKEENYLNPEDFKLFLNSFTNENSYKATIPLLQLCANIEYYCALRISEVLSLKRDDFNLKTRILTLNDTKTGHERCNCSTWDYKDSHSRTKTVLISVDKSCKKCHGTSKIKIKQFTTIPKPLLSILSEHFKTMKQNRKLFNFGRQTAWTCYKKAGVISSLEIREQQRKRSIEGVWTHLLRSSYVKFLQSKGASRELCQLKLRHIEKSAIDHYLRVDLQSLKIFEAKIFG